MTKEELEKEARFRTKGWKEQENCVQAYLAGAAPREKRIVELEAQIEKMKCCGNCGNERCTSKYRGNSAYHTQKDGFQCADNEDWKPRSQRTYDIRAENKT